MLQDVASVNSYELTEEVEFTQGDTVDIYFQLVDASLDKAVKGFVPSGRRYVPAAGATLSVKLDNIDDNIQVTRAASQPFANDSSIWKVSVLSTDRIIGTCAMVLTLTEAGKVTRGRIEAVVLIRSQSTV
jgi:hypothetical protein